MDSPRTPPQNPARRKKKAVTRASTGGFQNPFDAPQHPRSAGSMRRSMFAAPGGFSSPFSEPISAGSHMKKKKLALPKSNERFDVRVYLKPKQDPKNDGGIDVPVLPSDADQIQGVWEDKTTTERSPTLVWGYYVIPKDIGSFNVYGFWGYKPGIDFVPDKKYNPDDEATMKSFPVEDMWFYGPKAKMPKYFTPRGIWTYPLVSRNTSSLKDYETGLVTLGGKVDKTEDLDVSGQWKLLYQKGGSRDDEERGPGMKRRMKINIETPQRKTYILTVKPTDTINAIKVRIKEKSGIPKKEQRLVFNGYDLDDHAKTLEDYNIEDGDYLQLEPPRMKIHVQDWNGKTFTLKDVEPSDCIGDIKDKVQKARNIPFHLQRLVFDDQPLKHDKKSLEEYGIENEDTLELMPMQLKIKKPSGKTIPVIVNPTETVATLKKIISNKEGTPVLDQRLSLDGVPLGNNRMTLDDAGVGHGDTINLEPMQIYVKDWFGNITDYRVRPSDTLNSVKGRIERKLLVPKAMQRLRLENERLMKVDERTLNQYDVHHGDTLELLPMEVSAQTPEGKSVPIPVTPRDTVADLKRKIAEETGIPVSDQRLNYLGEPLDDDRETLEEVGILHGDTINIEGMRIHVKDWNGTLSTYDVTPNDTLEVVMQRVEQQQRIPRAAQRIAFDDTQLKDKNKTLTAYGIQHDDTLDLLPLQLIIETPEGKSIRLTVTPEDTVLDLKKMISRARGTPVSDQRLCFNHEPLSNDTDGLVDLGIGQGDIISLERTKVHVKDCTQRITTYDITANETLGAFKEKVEERLNIPKRMQRMFFDERPLKSNKKTMQQYGIQHNDTLELLPIEVTVKTPEGKSIPLFIEPTDSVIDLKEKVQEKEGIPVADQRLKFVGDLLDDDNERLSDRFIGHGDTINMEGMQIHIKDWEDKISTYDVATNDSLDSVKGQVEKRTNIAKQMQRIAFGDIPLENDSTTLGGYGIRHDDTLELLPLHLNVRTPEGDIISIIANPSDAVKDLKRKISSESGTPVSDQNLNHNGNLLKDDNDSLGNLGIRHGDTITMEKMIIYVKDWNGNECRYDVSSGDSLGSVKDRVEEEQKIQRRMQRVAFNGKLLDDNKMTLEQHGIHHNDTLELLPMELTIKTPQGKTIPVIVYPTDAVKALKEKVAEVEGTLVANQHLTYNDTPLDDDSELLDDLAIRHGDIVVLESMQIHVEDWEGQKFTYNVSPADTLAGFKEKVEERQKIPKELQRFMFGTQPMKKNKRSLKKYGIKHNDVLVLVPMQISVRTNEGKVIPIVIRPDDTVSDLKEAISKKEGTPVPDQHLTFSGIPLDNDRKPLDDFGIGHGDTIDLEGMQIHVQDWNGSNTTYNVSPSDTLQNVKKQIEIQQNVPMYLQRVFFNEHPLKDNEKTLKDYGIRHDDTLELHPLQLKIKTPEGETIPTIVNPTDTVKDLKKKIADKEGTPIADQRLYFNGTPLSDDRDTLDNLGIDQGDTISLEGTQIKIKDWNGNISTFDVSPSETLGSLKDRIEDQLEISRMNQRLSLNGENLDNDEKTLDQHKIKHNDTLVLGPMNIHIKTPNGKKFTIQANPDDPVVDVKKKLEKKLGIAPADQRLFFKDNQLPDQRTLDDCGIRHNDILTLEDLLIWVRDPMGRMLQVNAKPGERIALLKRKIQDEHGIPMNQQRLEFKGQPIEDQKTLNDYDIKHRDTLDMKPVEPMQIHAKMSNGRKVSLTVDPNDTIDDIKSRLEAETKTPAESQMVEYQGTKLANDQTLDDAGIQHNDTIRVFLKLEARKSPKPKRKSYLPANWKEQQQTKYGQTVVKTYEIDHDGPGDHIIVKKIGEERQSFQFSTPDG